MGRAVSGNAAEPGPEGVPPPAVNGAYLSRCSLTVLAHLVALEASAAAAWEMLSGAPSERFLEPHAPIVLWGFLRTDSDLQSASDPADGCGLTELPVHYADSKGG